MGLRKMFRPKEPTEQELVDEMQRVGIATKNPGGGRQEKFGAFKDYATERQSRKPGFAPVNPYAAMNAQGGNPYGEAGGANPYAQNGPNPGQSRQNQGQNPQDQNQDQNQGHNHNPMGRNPYAQRPHADRQAAQNPRDRNPYGADAGTNDRATSSGRPNPYARSTRSAYSARDDETLDLNDILSELPPAQLKRTVVRHDTDTLDLNAVSDDEDLNVGDDFVAEQEQVNLEDEEVEAIKQDIRFVKQESVQLTRNTLAHAMQADALGTNTLGMLGSQSERLYNAEQNLLLGETQTRIADEKVKELRRLNRSIFIPATGNPFNKKLRLRQQEAKLKTLKEQEKYLRETNRQGMYASEQRVKEGLTSNATSSDTYNKYNGERQLQQAQRYQFENDSEDDEMEKELASNLDQISAYTKKLRSTANLMGQEVDAQNVRLRKIEEDADRLDINVHLNTTRLHNIR